MIFCGVWVVSGYYVLLVMVYKDFLLPFFSFSSIAYTLVLELMVKCMKEDTVAVKVT